MCFTEGGIKAWGGPGENTPLKASNPLHPDCTDPMFEYLRFAFDTWDQKPMCKPNTHKLSYPRAQYIDRYSSPETQAPLAASVRAR